MYMNKYSQKRKERYNTDEEYRQEVLRKNREYAKENPNKIIASRLRASIKYRLTKAKNYRKTSEYREYHRKRNAKWKDDNPEKVKAHNLARQIKILKGTKCIMVGCDKLATEKHHYDYSKPLDVCFICAYHHRKLDRSIFRDMKFWD